MGRLLRIATKIPKTAFMVGFFFGKRIDKLQSIVLSKNKNNLQILSVSALVVAIHFTSGFL